MDTLKTHITKLWRADENNQLADSLNSLDLTDLLIWLGQQDNSLRYHLALELDIPLAHLNATCETVTRLSTEF